MCYNIVVADSTKKPKRKKPRSDEQAKRASLRELSEMSPVEKENYYAQKRKEILREERDKKYQEQKAVQDATYDADPKSEQRSWSDQTKEEIKDEWEMLRTYAKNAFPEGHKYYGLTPNNKLFAIAFCLNWPIKKISAACGVSEPTLYRWANRPDIKIFMDEFNIKQGRKDIMDKLSELEYKSICFIEDLLSEEARDDSTRRLKMDAAKWVFERTRGKANQPIEHKGNMLRDLYSQVENLKIADLTDEEEAEIFDGQKLN